MSESPYPEFALAIDKGWTVLTGVLVMFMQPGFMLLEVGATRVQHATSVLLKNFGDGFIVTLVFWFSYGIAFGFSEDHFAGSPNASPNRYFIIDESYALWFFQCSFACAMCTIVSGCVIERISYGPYFIVTMWNALITYPFIAHWIWGPTGWLAAANPNSFLGGSADFAGAGPVHLTGGIAGLMGTLILGPRIGVINFSTGAVQKTKGHSVALQGLGTLILWFGWYGFNCGSTTALSGNWVTTAARIGVNSSVAAAAGGLGSVATSMIIAKKKIFELDAIMNGILCALAAITSGCHLFFGWESVIVGWLSGTFFQISDQTLPLFGIDDPVSAVSVHAVGGLWGLISTGLFAHPSDKYPNQRGLFRGGTDLIAANLLEVLVVAAWAAMSSTIIFTFLHRVSWLRVASQDEIRGIDEKIGITAYPQLHAMLSSINLEAQFDEMVENNTNIKLWCFHRFLKLEFASESLDFLFSCRYFKERAIKLKSDPESNKDLFQIFNYIMKTYVLEGSSQAITLPDQVREELVNLLTTCTQESKSSEKDGPKIPVSALDVAEQEMYSALKTGPFKRFAYMLKSKDAEPLDGRMNSKWKSVMTDQDMLDEAIWLTRVSALRSSKLPSVFNVTDLGGIDWVESISIRAALRIGASEGRMKGDSRAGDDSIVAERFDAIAPTRAVEMAPVQEGDEGEDDDEQPHKKHLEKKDSAVKRTVSDV